ncbi:hypothetical protein Tco_0744986 [Tanacetum coccineum]
MSATSLNHTEILAIHEASQECILLRSVIHHIQESCGISLGEEALTVVHEDNATCIAQLKDGYIKGPDGFTFGFYRRYWSVIEKDVVKVVSYSFRYGTLHKGGNSSFIPLIPKTQNAKMVKDFRPTSLIGSLYKIIAKTLVNRLVVVLGDIVNELQLDFVANRQILDGPFNLNELIR